MLYMCYEKAWLCISNRLPIDATITHTIDHMPAVTSPILRNLHTPLQMFPAMSSVLSCRVVLCRVFANTHFVKEANPNEKRIAYKKHSMDFTRPDPFEPSYIVNHHLFFFGVLAASFLLSLSCSIDIFLIPIITMPEDGRRKI